MPKLSIDWTQTVVCVGPCGRPMRNKRDTTKDSSYGPAHVRSGLCSTCVGKQGVDTFSLNIRRIDGDLVECLGCRELQPKKKFVKSPTSSTGVKGQCYDCNKAKRYGLSRQELDSRIENQGNVCYICKRPPTEGGKSLHIDHDRSCCSGQKSCGKCVRKLLCHNCNVALGLVFDSPDILKSMITYLEEHKIE